jgi:hypothetical protein
VISCAALFVALGSAGYAATGGNFILGQANDADATSAISSDVAIGPTLSLTNSGGKPAAAFATNSGVAPFTVNQGAKVSKLNADKIDGIDSANLLQTTTPAGGDLSGTLGALQLGPGVVGSPELADDSIDGGKIVNNSLTTADIAGTDTSGMVSYPAGSVPSGRCIQSTISVGGAQVGQVALLATNGTLQNGILLYPMRVATAGHLTIDLCNFSGTTHNAIASLPIRIVTFG